MVIPLARPRLALSSPTASTFIVCSPCMLSTSWRAWIHKARVEYVGHWGGVMPSSCLQLGCETDALVLPLMH